MASTTGLVHSQTNAYKSCLYLYYCFFEDVKRLQLLRPPLFSSITNCTVHAVVPRLHLLCTSLQSLCLPSLSRTHHPVTQSTVFIKKNHPLFYVRLSVCILNNHLSTVRKYYTWPHTRFQSYLCVCAPRWLAWRGFFSSSTFIQSLIFAYVLPSSSLLSSLLSV